MALPAGPHIFFGIFAVIQVKFTIQELPSNGKSFIYLACFHLVVKNMEYELM